MSLILRNARVGDDVVDVLVEDGIITEIGSAVDCTAEEIHLDGRWVRPGLWDNHVHFSQWALSQRRLDVSGASSAREAAALVSAALAGAGPAAGPAPQSPAIPTQPEPPFVAVGFRDGLWPNLPNLAVLDAATGAIPVVLVSGDLHAVWLNSAALALYGHAGHQTGVLREEAAFEITRLVGVIPDAVLDSWADAAAGRAAARGIVGIVDLEMAWNLETWTRRIQSGTNALRVETGIYPEHLDRAIALGLRTGRRVSDLLSIGPFKVITDGSLNTRTAYCYDEYPGLTGRSDSHGLLAVPPEELLPLLRRAAEAGLVPAVHAIGDRANALALDAFETLGIGGRIEHAQLLAPADVGRFAALGVVASVQPEHAVDDRDVADRHWAGRTDRAFALRSLLDAGAELALGSDAPVAPLDPWVTIAAAVSRARDGREPWHPEQRITVAEALAASGRTRVAVGQPADLVVTELDPLTAGNEQLREMPVAATLLGGRLTHNSL